MIVRENQIINRWSSVGNEQQIAIVADKWLVYGEWNHLFK